MGWSKKNMMNITQLRIMSANGQAIQYEDLRKAEEDKIAFKNEKELVLLNTLHSNKKIKRKIQSSLQTLSRNLPVLENAAPAASAAERICPTCGNPVPPQNKFCTSCGTPVGE